MDPSTLLSVPGVVSHVEFLHELAGYTAFLRRLSTFARVVTFDKRGQGLSDRMSGAPSLEQRMDDVRAIMDEIGSRRAVLMGFSEGCPMSVLFAATYPERVSHLALFGGFARAADRMPADVWEAGLVRAHKELGHRRNDENGRPQSGDEPGRDRPVRQVPATVEHPWGFQDDPHVELPDRRHLDPSDVRVPTLVLHRQTDAQVAAAHGRNLAAQIPGAKYIEYPGGDHLFWTGDTEAVLGDIEEFITGHRDSVSTDLERVLATVLFTDIVDSTRSAAQVGDQRWRQFLDNHDQLARQMVERHRGNLVKSTGDGILATFDGPGRAVRCALSFGTAAQQIGLPLRAGLHTGEIELRGRDIGGIAVHAAARVMAQSGSNEVLVSRVVTDLVAGAGLKFAVRGSFELKGLPGRWDLFAASA